MGAVPARERLPGHVELGEAGQGRAQGPDAGGPEGFESGLRRRAQEVRRRGPAAGLLVGRGARLAEKEKILAEKAAAKAAKKAAKAAKAAEGEKAAAAAKSARASKPVYYGHIKGIAQPATYGVGAPKK